MARAVVFEEPGELDLRDLEIAPPGPGEVLVDVEWTGISTGTEKLLYDGRMPAFPGMGYPLVPGYETVGRVSACGDGVSVSPGDGFSLQFQAPSNFFRTFGSSTFW